MSRFNNPRTQSTLSFRRDSPGIGVAAEPLRASGNGAARANAPSPNQAAAPAVEPRPNMMQTICFLTACTYLLSGCANDLVFHLTGGRAYISAVCEVALPILFLGTGAFLRGLQAPAGKWFAAFAIWLLIATPFSVWKGGSANVVVNYLGRSFLLCFYLAACTVTMRQVRTVVRMMGIGALFAILSCFAFGGWKGGRFSIPNSLFYGNANELGLQLLLGIIVLMYVFFEKNRPAKFVSVIAIVISVIYILKTGSRGTLLATLATGGVIVLMSRQRTMVILLAIPALIAAFILAPPEMRRRITLIGGDAQTATSGADVSAIESRMQREKLLKISIVLAFTHPLFGIGPGQFAVKVSEDQGKKGEFQDWLGTHNTYSQVASEAGLPAFIFYVATIVACMRMNYRLYRKTFGRAGLEQIAGISFCLFLSIFAYSIAVFFFHLAYVIHLPLLVGVSISLYLTAKPIVERESALV